MNELTFDGITFHSDSELMSFLKQSYHAHKSTIRALQDDRDKYRSTQQKSVQQTGPCPICGTGRNQYGECFLGHVVLESPRR